METSKSRRKYATVGRASTWDLLSLGMRRHHREIVLMRYFYQSPADLYPEGASDVLPS
jgi:hypothetical protein